MLVESTRVATPRKAHEPHARLPRGHGAQGAAVACPYVRAVRDRYVTQDAFSTVPHASSLATLTDVWKQHRVDGRPQ